MTEPEYRDLNLLSYSQLSGVDYSPASLLNTVRESSEALTYGSAVDTLAFDGREEFEKKFVVMNQEKPSWMLEKVLKSLVQELFATHDELDGPISSDLNDYEDLILQMAKHHEYGKGWKSETIIRKTVEACGELFKHTIENIDKQALSLEQYENVENSVNTLYTHPFTKDSFVAEEGIEIFYQFPIVWEYTSGDITFKCKSLLDILKIDHNEKKIYPIDLKTTGKSVLAFRESFIQWHYYIQAAFYTDAVKYLRDKLYPELSGYSVELFKFVVISSKRPIKPLTWLTTPKDISCGKYGGFINGENVKGYLQLASEMKWHIDNSSYDYPKEIYDSKGNVTLDVFD